MESTDETLVVAHLRVNVRQTFEYVWLSFECRLVELTSGIMEPKACKDILLLILLSKEVHLLQGLLGTQVIRRLAKTENRPALRVQLKAPGDSGA